MWSISSSVVKYQQLSTMHTRSTLFSLIAVITIILPLCLSDNLDDPIPKPEHIPQEQAAPIMPDQPQINPTPDLCSSDPFEKECLGKSTRSSLSEGSSIQCRAELDSHLCFVRNAMYRNGQVILNGVEPPVSSVAGLSLISRVVKKECNNVIDVPTFIFPWNSGEILPFIRQYSAMWDSGNARFGPDILMFISGEMADPMIKSFAPLIARLPCRQVADIPDNTCFSNLILRDKDYGFSVSDSFGSNEEEYRRLLSRYIEHVQWHGVRGGKLIGAHVTIVSSPHILNENELVDHLRRQSIATQVVDFDNMTVSEQMDQLARTNILISGRFMPNAVFLTAPAAVISLMPYGSAHHGFVVSRLLTLSGKNYLEVELRDPSSARFPWPLLDNNEICRDIARRRNITHASLLEHGMPLTSLLDDELHMLYSQFWGRQDFNVDLSAFGTSVRLALDAVGHQLDTERVYAPCVADTSVSSQLPHQPWTRITLSTYERDGITTMAYIAFDIPIWNVFGDLSLDVAMLEVHTETQMPHSIAVWVGIAEDCTDLNDRTYTTRPTFTPLNRTLIMQEGASLVDVTDALGNSSGGHRVCFVLYGGTSMVKFSRVLDSKPYMRPRLSIDFH